MLYMAEHPGRMQRLYDQLIPFGTLCNVTLTNEHLPKLAPRSTPAVVVSASEYDPEYDPLNPAAKHGLGEIVHQSKDDGEAPNKRLSTPILPH
jgi:hypothetical protein